MYFVWLLIHFSSESTSFKMSALHQKKISNLQSKKQLPSVKLRIGQATSRSLLFSIHQEILWKLKKNHLKNIHQLQKYSNHSKKSNCLLKIDQVFKTRYKYKYAHNYTKNFQSFKQLSVISRLTSTYFQLGCWVWKSIFLL